MGGWPLIRLCYREDDEPVRRNAGSERNRARNVGFKGARKRKTELTTREIEEQR